MEADWPAGTVARFHFGRRAVGTFWPHRRQQAANQAREPLDCARSAAGCEHFDGPDLVETSQACVRLGPRRRRKPGVRMDDLPDIDAMIISHNHYDHLDLPTLRGLAADSKDRRASRTVTRALETPHEISAN
jgi:hypothetical protein